MQQIRAIRERAGITAKALAKLVGIEHSALYHYELGRRTPDFTRCWAIVNALNELGAVCSFADVFPNPMAQTENPEGDDLTASQSSDCEALTQ